MRCALSVPAPSSTESTVGGAAFEGLFVRTLQPQGAFADQLRAAGYDVKAPRDRYPRRVWQACVELARKHEYPTRPPEEGFRLLGQRFAEGFRQTLTGKLLGAALPMLGPEAVMQRLPKVWASSQPNLRVQPAQLGPGHWEVTFEDQGIMTDFCAGLLDGLLAVLRVPEPRVQVRVKEPARCVLVVRWRA